MAAIARRTNVAVQTVYFVFHTKPPLLTTAIDTAVMGEEDSVPPELTDWWQEATTTPDGRHAIELFVANVAEILTRAAALDRVAVAAATTDPEIVDLLAHHESLRTQASRAYVDSLAARGLLRHRLDPTEATDVLLTLAGSETYLSFTRARGWTLQRYVTWATDVPCTMLLNATDSNARPGSCRECAFVTPPHMSSRHSREPPRAPRRECGRRFFSPPDGRSAGAVDRIRR